MGSCNQLLEVMPVSLNGFRRLCDTLCVEEGESCTDNSLLDVYANRHQYDSSNDMININFVQFVSKYKYSQHTPPIPTVQIMAFIANINY